MNNSPSNLRNRIEEVSHETNNRLNKLEKKMSFKNDALLHKLQDELDNLEEQLYMWEDVPNEDLWEDGELDCSDVAHKIFHRVVLKGNWKLMRRKDDD